MEKYDYDECYEPEVKETSEAYASAGRDEIQYEIVNHLGVLRMNQNGWNRELNIVSWNGRQANFDLRDWTPDHNRMKKGITLTRDEMRKLCKMFEDDDAQTQKTEEKIES